MTMTRPTTEQITHNGQILKDVLGPVYNVLAYGAKGDGVTDDLNAIRDAVNAAKAAGGGTVFIPRTANGYYVSVNAGCNLGGSNGISIVSDGAEIKMQGATNLTAGANAVLFFGNNVSNFTMRGLRFSATSTVLRYNNGDSAYDAVVLAGDASALAQTSFRYVHTFQGDCENIVVDSCDFLTGIYYGCSVKNATVPGNIKNLRFTNLRAIGVNHILVFTNDCDGILVQNVVVDGGQDCRLDHLLYTEDDCTNILVSDCEYRNNNGVPYTFSLGPKNITLNNLVSENVTEGGQLIFRGGAENVVATNLQFLNCTGESALGFNGTSRNVLLSSVLFRDCSLAFFIGDTSRTATCVNFTMRDFVIDSCDSAGIVNSGTGIVLENGLIVDSQASGQFCMTTGPTGGAQAPLVASDLTIRNVDFVYTVGNPPSTVMPLTGALWNITLDNVSFRRIGGTTSIEPIFNNGSVVNVRNCRLDGFTSNLVNSTSIAPTGEVINVQPLEQTLTANSATPSVASGRLFVTANTNPTSYTNFTGGVQGQEICVRVNDANTTFDLSSTSLKGNNGVDYAATSGDVIFAKLIGSNWFCTICEA